MSAYAKIAIIRENISAREDELAKEEAADRKISKTTK